MIRALYSSQPLSVEDQLAALDALNHTCLYFDATGNPENGLRCTTVGEALDEVVFPLDGELDEIPAARVSGWVRKVVPEDWKNRVARRLIERFMDEFDEPEAFGPLEDSTECQIEARKLVDSLLTKVTVWQCAEVGSVTLTNAALRAIAKREGWSP